MSSILIPTNPNENGEVAFDASIEGGDEDLPVDSGIFLAGASGIVKLVRVGDSGPGGVGRFTGFLLGGLNDSGQVIFRSRLFQNKSSVEGLYRVGPGSKRGRARAGIPAGPARRLEALPHYREQVPGPEQQRARVFPGGSHEREPHLLGERFRNLHRAVRKQIVQAISE